MSVGLWSKHDGDLESVVGVLEALRTVISERKYEVHRPALMRVYGEYVERLCDLGDVERVMMYEVLLKGGG